MLCLWSLMRYTYACVSGRSGCETASTSKLQSRVVSAPGKAAVMLQQCHLLNCIVLHT